LYQLSTFLNKTVIKFMYYHFYWSFPTARSRWCGHTRNCFIC